MPDILFLFAWFLGGFVNGISGIGSSMLAVPIVVSIMPAQDVIPTACLIVTAISAQMAWTFRHGCRMQSLKMLFLGSIPGSFVGLGILLYISSSTLQLGAGIVMVSFVLLNVLKRETGIRRTETYPIGMTAGFASGILNTSISFGGPPLGAYALYAGWDQKEALGTMNTFSLAAFIVTCIVQASAGLYTPEVLIWAAWGIPASILGIFCSIPVARHINPVTFKRILLLVIGCSGLNCIVRAFSM